MTADTFCLAAAPALRVLHVEGDFSTGGVESFARQLRTNTTQVELKIYAFSCCYRELFRAVERVMQLHNYTIRNLRTEDCYDARRALPRSDASFSASAASPEA